MNICKYANFKFAHHHVHTEYSPWDAPVSLKKLVEYSKHLGYKTVTVTDHGTVSSWVKLAGLCKQNGLKPIFGIEGYFTPDRHLHKGGRDSYHCVLLAKNSQGVKNIYRLSELAYREGFYYDPRFDWDLLEKYGEGLVCTTSCISGYVPYWFTLDPQDPKDKLELEEQYKLFPGTSSPYDLAKQHALRFQKIFGKNFFAEVQFHGPEIEKAPYAGVANLANELKLKIVGTNDVHYLRQQDANTQEAMMAINQGKCIKEPKRIRHESNQLYLKSPDEMIDVLGGRNRAAVMGALEIADICTAELNSKTQLPSIEIPKGKTDLQFLEEQAMAGLRRIGKEGNPVYEARFKEEIDVIRNLREKGKYFDKYFLVVWDYVNWAWENGIRVGVGRGSGAGSLILYCLRITGIDPIPYDLLFERFLAEDRNEMPDIDIDFDHEGGERVYEYVCKKYGVAHCARIGTFQQYHVASALRTAFRVFDPGNTFERDLSLKQEAEQTKKVNGMKGIALGEKKSSVKDENVAMVNALCKLLPKDPNSGGPSSKCTLLKEVYDKNPEEMVYVYDSVPEFKEWKRRYPEIFALAEDIEGILDKRSVHAAGVLITEDPLVDVCPQQFSGKAKTLATAFDMGDVEKIGGVKFDFLRTKVLSVLSRTIASIKERYGKVIDIDNLQVDDRDALAVFERGDTTAIFQFESDGMRNMLKSMKGITFDDVIAANALFRPGPMEHIPSYCRRKTGAEQVSYAVPMLEPILKPTLGIIVYQEQVMKTVRVLAGFTASEADKVRKAMGKKKKDLLDQMKEKFIKGCAESKSCSAQVAQTLWAQMEKFGAYAFNKSHSAGYGYTAYQCAWLKAHFPEEFMAAQLSVEAGDACYEDVAFYERASKQMGIKMLPVNVNLSKADYTVVDVGGKKAIRNGFKGVLGLGQSHVDIVAGQPYKDMFDYCMRSGTGANSGIVSSLIDLGAFDDFRPKLGVRLGLPAEATRGHLQVEYNDKKKRADTEKRGAIKENRKNMPVMFPTDDEDEPQRVVDIAL